MTIVRPSDDTTAVVGVALSRLDVSGVRLVEIWAGMRKVAGQFHELRDAKMEPTQQPQTTPTQTPAATARKAHCRAAAGDDQLRRFCQARARVATVVECKPHPNADKLLVLQIDLGNGERRQICAGLRQHYQPEQLVGKQIVVVANLAPRADARRDQPGHAAGRHRSGHRPR